MLKKTVFRYVVGFALAIVLSLTGSLVFEQVGLDITAQASTCSDNPGAGGNC